MKSSNLIQLLLNRRFWKQFSKNFLVGLSIFTLLITSQIGVLSTNWDKGPSSILADEDSSDGGEGGSFTVGDGQGGSTTYNNNGEVVNSVNPGVGIGDVVKDAEIIEDNQQPISGGVGKTQAGKIGFDPKTQAGTIGPDGKPVQAGPVGPTPPTQAGTITPAPAQPTPQPTTPPGQPTQPDQPGPGPSDNLSNLQANCVNNTINLSWNMSGYDSVMIRIDDTTISGWGGYGNPQRGDTLIDFYRGTSYSRTA